jgi:hypothetical protein
MLTIMMLATLVYWTILYGVPTCLLVAILAGLIKHRRFKATFFWVLLSALIGMTIAVSGYGLFLIFMVLIRQDAAFAGQGLGIALAGPIIFAPLGAIGGGLIGLLYPLGRISKR